MTRLAQFDPALTELMSSYGVNLADVPPATRIEVFVSNYGEPAFGALVLGLEMSLPEEFPELLLEQIETIGELFDFAGIKRSRVTPPI